MSNVCRLHSQRRAVGEPRRIPASTQTLNARNGGAGDVIDRYGAFPPIPTPLGSGRVEADNPAPARQGA